MGQAKRRGSFEERRQQSIANREEETRKADAEADRLYAERQAAAQAKWDAMTPEEQDAALTRNRRRRSPMGMIGILPMLMLAGMGSMGSPIPPGRRRR
jgi:hypothetical protein